MKYILILALFFAACDDKTWRDAIPPSEQRAYDLDNYSLIECDYYPGLTLEVVPIPDQPVVVCRCPQE